MCEHLPPIIVTGCRRSGTTLLMAILSRHPGLRAHPKETQFLLGAHRRFGDRIPDRQAGIAYMANHPYCAPGVGEAEINAHLAPGPSATLSSLAAAYLCGWMDGAAGSETPVLKDPAFVYSLPLLAGWFPGLRVVHVLRDPRGTVSSQRARWPKATVTECAILWRIAVRSGQAWGKAHPDRYSEVHYDRLVRDPETEVAGLCNALGVEYTASMLDFELDEPQYGPAGPVSVVQFRAVDRERSIRWKEHLSHVEVRLVETICAREMRANGYIPSSSAAPVPGLRIRRIWEGLGYWFLRLGRAAKQAFRRLKFRLFLGL